MEYGREGQRRPGMAGDQQTSLFLSSTVPPMMTGHWLMRRTQAARERTWTSAEDAVVWLERAYVQMPPTTRESGRAYVGLDVKTAYARDVLPGGVDVTWAYWTGGGSLASFSVVACPNLHHPRIPCPLPPS